MAVFIAKEGTLQTIKSLLGDTSASDNTSQGLLNQILSEIEDGVFVIPNMPISIQTGGLTNSTVSVTGKGRVRMFAPHRGTDNTSLLGTLVVDGVQICTNAFMGIYGYCEIDFKQSLSMTGTNAPYAILFY